MRPNPLSPGLALVQLAASALGERDEHDAPENAPPTPRPPLDSHARRLRTAEQRSDLLFEQLYLGAERAVLCAQVGERPLRMLGRELVVAFLRPLEEPRQVLRTVP